MAIFKCKMCGGQIEISESISTCTCDYCGTEQIFNNNENLEFGKTCEFETKIKELLNDNKF